jgi:hypothetical protein
MTKETEILNKIEGLESEMSKNREMFLSINKMLNEYLMSEARQCQSECGPWYEYYNGKQDAA